jgi:hypothetical protein
MEFRGWRCGIVVAAWAILGAVGSVQANNNIRSMFFTLYPTAVGTRLDNLPSRSGHCGVCHYNFQNGGNPWNPYGEAVRSYTGKLNTAVGQSNAIVNARFVDQDSDGYVSHFEITNRTFANTPTFPGLSIANTGQVAGIPLSEIASNLTPSAGADITPPSVLVQFPNGGEALMANRATNITWTASDAGGAVSISIQESLNNGVSYSPLAFGLPNSGSFAWFPANRPTTAALIRVVGTDTSGNTTSDTSNAAFTIASPPGGRVATTLRDFDMPGTQPLQAGPELASPTACATCHGDYNTAVEPYYSWKGSMMAHASLDPLFEANMAIANQDAPDSGDLCLRCHFSRGWLGGRSVPTDGSRMQTADQIGVSCDLCHSMVDPVFKAGNPTADTNILAALTFRGTNYGNGMYVIDPADVQRGPFTNVTATHAFAISPFHRSAAFCGTCHDVSNPAFVKDAGGTYQPNSLNATSSTFSAYAIAPVERTYSEWLHSRYNTSTGVYAPEFAGNKAGGMVSTCQDCHMRDVSGQGCNPDISTNVPVRNDLPLHDMTGGSTWIPSLLTNLYPAAVDAAAIEAGIGRATYLLQNAADIGVAKAGARLKVMVTNQCGHKLPTGYPEGRRIWINVRFFDGATNLIGESGAYDPATGILTHDAEVKIYEVHPGIDTNISALVGVPSGPSLHFVLNNRIFSDNRIPPRGFSNSTFAAFGGAPVDYTYPDGQYWDSTFYDLPPSARRAEVRLYYQSTSKEFVEFLRDENTNNAAGDVMYDLWNNNGKCPPTLMTSAEWSAPAPLVSGVAPSCGPTAGGTALSIAGSDFRTGAVVWVGGSAATNVQVLGETAITAMTAPGTAGTADVTVVNLDGQSGTIAEAFVYVAPPAFAGLAAVTAGVEFATLTWPNAASTEPVTYSIYVATAAGAQNFASPYASTTVTSAVFAPLDPGSTNAITYYFVVRASGACGGGEKNVAELSVQPLLDPVKDQDADGMPNGFETLYDLDPFDPDDASLDSDDDGYSNGDEFIAMTNPKGPLSYLRIMDMTSTEIILSSAVGRVYLMEGGTLASGLWDVVESNWPGTGGFIQIPITNAPEADAYRVRVTMP